MRIVTLDASDSMRLTPYAAGVCQELNEWKRNNPHSTFKQMEQWYNRDGYKISQTTISRLYYGYHALHDVRRPYHNRVRMGASVTIA